LLRPDGMIVVVMGVAGSGKTSIGTELARQLHWIFLDADDFHSVANIARMRSGSPLTEEDREPWLGRLREALSAIDGRGASVVLACSALTEHFREHLSAGLSDVRFVYLEGTFTAIQKRLRARAGHFFSATMLQSQFDTLEEPTGALVIDTSEPPDVIVRRIRNTMALQMPADAPPLDG
jgi:gluconokinase